MSWSATIRSSISESLIAPACSALSQVSLIKRQRFQCMTQFEMDMIACSFLLNTRHAACQKEAGLAAEQATSTMTCDHNDCATQTIAIWSTAPCK